MTRRAFTIVEVTVTVTIIAILMGIVAASINTVRVTQRDARRVSDVLLIGKAIDQTAQVNRGIYPRNSAVNPTLTPVYTQSDQRMCADWAAIEPSLFPSNKIPTDPSPAKPRTRFDAGFVCADMRDGYTYTTRFVPNAASLAKQLGVQYTIDFGLERQRSATESALKPASELIGATVVTDPNRFRYVLTGPYCGSVPVNDPCDRY